MYYLPTFNRLPRIWNALPIINCDLSVITIKRKLINYLWNHFEINFDPNDTCTFIHFYVQQTPQPPNFDTL